MKLLLQFVSFAHSPEERKKNNRNHYRNVWHRIGDGWNLNAIKYHSFLTLLLRHFFVHFCSRNNEKSKFVKIDLFLSELSWLLQKQTETTMKLRYSLYIFAKAKSEKKNEIGYTWVFWHNDCGAVINDFVVARGISWYLIMRKRAQRKKEKWGYKSKKDWL